MRHRIKTPGDLAETIADAYQQACRLELASLKPGNVHRFAEGHRMSVEDFLTSAQASAAPLVAPGLGLGERIYRAVAATREAVGCNTNLGIILLCAPLIHGLLHVPSGSLRQRLAQVLRGADKEDAGWLFRAIALAAPGGLGRSDKYDVHSKPTADLRQVMAYSAARDRIAYQYANDYVDLFEFALPGYLDYQSHRQNPDWAISRLYLGLLAQFPDTHIERSHGPEKALDISRRAAALAERFDQTVSFGHIQNFLLQADEEFKREGINPGTTADLTVATLLIERMQQICSAFEQEAGFSRNCDSLSYEGRVRI